MIIHSPNNMSSAQQAMVHTWEQHMAAEFQLKDVDATMETMSANPYLNHVPVMTGGESYEAIKYFYGHHFSPGHPSDTEVIPVSRTVGNDRIVDELIHKFTHNISMRWILPGIPPTDKKIEVAVVVIIEFEEGKILGERIYWDQASVLVQLGLLDRESFPVVGVESARKVLDHSKHLSNDLIEREGNQD